MAWQYQGVSRHLPGLANESPFNMRQISASIPNNPSKRSKRSEVIKHKPETC